MICAMMALPVVIPYHANAATKSLTELKKEREALKAKTDAAKKALQEAQSKKQTVVAEIDSLDQTILAAQAELDQVNKDFENVSARLSNSEIELANATVAREKQFDTFGKRIKYIYENGSVGYLDTLLASESFDDLLLRMQYVQDIMDYDNNILADLKEKEEIIHQKTEDIKEEKAEVETLKTAQQEKMSSLEELMSQKKAAMEEIEKDAAKYAQLIESNEKASNEVERLIQQASSSGDNSAFVYTGGKLNWPVPSRAPSPSSLSSGYVGRKRPIGSGYEFHTGYDIPAAYGSNIVAAEAGTVITAGWVNGYGNTVIINHGGGLSTLYGHNSSLVVSVGQKVTRGQTIAKCGSTGNSTGNHCHFEVRINGKHTSPEQYLGVRNIAS